MLTLQVLEHEFRRRASLRIWCCVGTTAQVLLFRDKNFLLKFYCVEKVLNSPQLLGDIQICWICLLAVSLISMICRRVKWKFYRLVLVRKKKS